jgi:hypothetical protein
MIDWTKYKKWYDALPDFWKKPPPVMWPQSYFQKPRLLWDIWKENPPQDFYDRGFYGRPAEGRLSSENPKITYHPELVFNPGMPNYWFRHWQKYCSLPKLKYSTQRDPTKGQGPIK